jgi:hypothetical protein
MIGGVVGRGPRAVVPRAAPTGGPVDGGGGREASP